MTPVLTYRILNGFWLDWILDDGGCDKYSSVREFWKDPPWFACHDDQPFSLDLRFKNF